MPFRSKYQMGHGIKNAYYVLCQYGGHEPVLECLCGFTSKGFDWADIGAEFDDHLKETDKKENGT